MPRGPDGRTVLTRPYTLNTCNGPIGGRSDIYRLSYRIRTLSRPSTASCARRSRRKAASPTRTPPESSSTSPCRTRSRNGRAPGTGRPRCWRSKFTSATGCLTLQT